MLRTRALDLIQPSLGIDPFQATVQHASKRCCDTQDCATDVTHLGEMTFKNCVHKCSMTTGCNAVEFGISQPCGGLTYGTQKLPYRLENGNSDLCRVVGGGGNWAPPHGCARSNTMTTARADDATRACFTAELLAEADCGPDRCTEAAIGSCEVILSHIASPFSTWRQNS